MAQPCAGDLVHVAVILREHTRLVLSAKNGAQQQLLPCLRCIVMHLSANPLPARV
jgi:hypothetical protein